MCSAIITAIAPVTQTVQDGYLGLFYAECSSVFQSDLLTDHDLADVVDAWAELPEAIKAGIVAMMKAAIGARHGSS